MAADPMCVEASLYAMPKAAAAVPAGSVHSIDRDPRHRHVSGSLCPGVASKLIEEGFDLLMDRCLCLADVEDGSLFLFEPSAPLDLAQRSLALETDIYLLGLEKVYSSEPLSPFPTVSEPSLVMGVMSRYDPEFEVVASSPVSGGGSVPAVPSVEEFIASFKKLLPQLVLPSTPRLRKTRSAHTEEDDDWVPKRSTRLAAKSKFRADKPEAQARKVMMKKLGFEIETEIPDEASFDEFQTTFRLPLTPSKREAMQVLFPGRKQRALGAVRAA